MTNKLPVVGKRYRYKSLPEKPELDKELYKQAVKVLGRTYSLEEVFKETSTKLLEEQKELIDKLTVGNVGFLAQEVGGLTKNCNNIIPDVERTHEFNITQRFGNVYIIESLSRALGLIEGALEIKNMEDFNKEGLIRNLEEIRDILKANLDLKTL